MLSIDVAVVAKRIKEAMGSDTQQELADKIRTTQGNISKILRGERLPSVDNIFYISKTYGVSVDWLLGLSDVKGVAEREESITYASVVETIVEMIRCGNEIDVDQTSGVMDVYVSDLLLNGLCMKGAALKKADCDSYKTWVKEKLAAFGDKPLLLAAVWNDRDLSGDLKRATSEEEMLAVYKIAKAEESELMELIEIAKLSE